MHSFPKGLKKDSSGDFPSGPVVKILPSDAGYTSWIPGQATKISHASGQLNLCSATTELTHCIAKVWMRQRRPNAAKKKYFRKFNEAWFPSQTNYHTIS